MTLANTALDDNAAASGQGAGTSMRLLAPRCPELLSPAGGPEAFSAALAAGADAIYCGMGDFNARRKADNFTDESFSAACRSAHLAGARVYVTVNIVIKDSEMPRALELVSRCAQLGADAFIIQDWGLFFEIRRLMPELETHISTQANIHDVRGAAWCRQAGADRVTLSRELSLAEISEISRVGIDLEVFAHGSICFSYSGVCLLSSFACSGRSANRGMCAQPCRLPYELIDETGRIVPTHGRDRALCPRDTCTEPILDEVLASGAKSLKLEGRMKAPDYVHSVTRAYRDALDELLGRRREDLESADARSRRLKRAFNRDFTCAYQHGTSGDEMMSYERSNNRGQIVGEVVSSRPLGNTRGLHPDDRRVRAAIVGLALTEPVGKGDLLELRHPDEFDRFLTVIASEDARAGDLIEARAARPMPKGSVVRLIRSQRALDEAAAALHASVPRKRPVDVHVIARIGKPFRIELTCADDRGFSAKAEGFAVEAARTRPVTADDLVEHVGRMGSSPFEALSFDIELDEDAGMGFSAVHKIRAAACEALERAICEGYEARAARLIRAGTSSLGDFEKRALTADTVDSLAGDEVCGGTASTSFGSDADTETTPEVCAVAATLEAARAAHAAGADRIYMDVEHLGLEDISPDDASELGIVPVLDEVCRMKDLPRLDPWIRTGAPVAVGSISELALAYEMGAKAELRSCIPVHNLACIRALEQRGAQGFWLSPELTLAEIERFAPCARASAGIFVVGKPRVMTSEHCILQVADACIHDCARCALRKRNLALKNIDGKVLPIRTDLQGRSHLYDGRLLDITPQIPQLIKAGVSRFCVDGTLMDSDELAGHVKRTRRAVECARTGTKPSPRIAGSTSGCLFVGVE